MVTSFAHPQGSGCFSFSVDGIHPHDLSTFLDQQGIAIRAGHHCAQPLMHELGQTATARASFGIYNTMSEVDAFFEGLDQAYGFFSRFR
jgi:Selenocysteine lyase